MEQKEFIRKMLNGYELLEIDEENQSNNLACVMCFEKAAVIAHETNEGLCYNCMISNNEARISHGK